MRFAPGRRDAARGARENGIEGIWRKRRAQREKARGALDEICGGEGEECRAGEKADGGGGAAQGMDAAKRRLGCILPTGDVTGREEFSRCARHFFAGILSYFKEK